MRKRFGNGVPFCSPSTKVLSGTPPPFALRSLMAERTSALTPGFISAVKIFWFRVSGPLFELFRLLALPTIVHCNGGFACEPSSPCNGASAPVGIGIGGGLGVTYSLPSHSETHICRVSSQRSQPV